MALVLPTLISNISSAFKTPQWSAAANLLTNAIDAYIISGTPKTNVTATVTPPPPAVPFPSVGIGIGTIVTTSKGILLSACTSAFQNVSWQVIGSIIGPAIATLLSTAQITTVVSGGIVGNGTGNATPTGLSSLITELTTAFSSGTVWEQTATQIANAINTFIITAQVTTNDFGSIPNPWVGAGVGVIQ